MLKFPPRLILAALCAVTAAVILFYAKADPVPHDAKSRVTEAEFWTAINRTDPARRPTSIVVRPPHLGVQLITCLGHPAGSSAGVWKYLYITIAPGKPTVDARLKTLNVAFTSPWQDSLWAQRGPWIAFSFAAVLVVWGWAMSLIKLLSQASAKPSSPLPPKPQITAADLKKLHDLEDEIERNLTTSASAPSPETSTSTNNPAAPVALTGGPLQALEQQTQEDKDYKGEFYPVAHPKHNGFSLVELLVVIGILGVLIALLLPAITGARKDANAIVCAANLHSIAQGLAIYENENNGCIPASYSYIGQKIVNGQQTFDQQIYQHWSYFLYHSGSTPLTAFQCPELDQGGLPPTDTTPDQLESGQVTEVPNAVDQQAPRIAYTLNEALSPRNKFALNFQNSVRIYHFIRASSIANSSGTILATEFGNTAARFDATPGAFYVYSHRPVHGFVGLDGTLDMYQLNPAIHYRRITAADLDPDPSTAASSTTRLDWVGRNHGHMKPTYPDQRRSNFLYLDGHVECKSIYETLQPFEWGETFYTLDPNGDLKE